ncbi:MAG TPA: hypothetical protein VMZ25_10490 [Terriglobales bacterium]|nr:hypothetical protein [Terriglobales bacterium]
MRLARKLHLLSGIFFAPSIIFFALSGFFQSFGWHEEHDGKPPMAWVAAISEVHKDQRLPAPRPAPNAQPTAASSSVQPISAPSSGTPPGSAPNASPSSAPNASQSSATPTASLSSTTPAKSSAAGPRPPRRKKSFPLQVFMGFMAMGLIGSSLVGIWMAFQVNRNLPLLVGLLLAGTIVPIVALFLGIRA